MLPEGDADIPEESIVDTESSNGQGFAEFDASDQEDEHYVINAEDSSKGLAESEPDMWIVKQPVKEKKEVCQSQIHLFFINILTRGLFSEAKTRRTQANNQWCSPSHSSIGHPSHQCKTQETSWFQMTMSFTCPKVLLLSLIHLPAPNLTKKAKKNEAIGLMADWKKKAVDQKGEVTQMLDTLNTQQTSNSQVTTSLRQTWGRLRLKM